MDDISFGNNLKASKPGQVEMIGENQEAAAFSVNTMMSENPKVNAAVLILTLVDSLMEGLKIATKASGLVDLNKMDHMNSMAVINALHTIGASEEEMLEAAKLVDILRREMREQALNSLNGD